MNNWMSGIYCLLFFGFWGMVYDAANASISASSPSEDPELQASQPEFQTQLQKEWAAKAVEKYTASQKKKWRRWNEAMFERSD
jgi:hypothetical protein